MANRELVRSFAKFIGSILPTKALKALVILMEGVDGTTYYKNLYSCKSDAEFIKLCRQTDWSKMPRTAWHALIDELEKRDTIPGDTVLIPFKFASKKGPSDGKA